MPLVLFAISLVYSALISVLKAVESLSRWSANFASSSSSPAKPSMSSAKRRLVIILSPMLTAPSRSYEASVVILYRNLLKRVSENRHPSWTPANVRNQSPMLLLKRTKLVALSQRYRSLPPIMVYIALCCLPHGMQVACRLHSWSSYIMISATLGCYEIFHLCYRNVVGFKWLMCRVSERWLRVCFQPWCNPQWLTGLKTPTH